MTEYTFRIGDIVVEEPMVIRRHFETASWYQDILVQPGRYPLCMKPGDFKWCVALIPGVDHGSFFQSRLGAHYGRAQVDERVGQPAVAGIQLDEGSVAQMSHSGKANSGWNGQGKYRAEIDPSIVEVYQCGTYDGAAIYRIRGVAERAIHPDNVIPEGAMVISSGFHWNHSYLLRMVDHDGELAVEVRDLVRGPASPEDPGRRMCIKSVDEILGHDDKYGMTFEPYSAYVHILPEAVQGVKDWVREQMEHRPSAGMRV